MKLFDEQIIKNVINLSLKSHPDKVNDYLNNKKKGVIGLFMGECMKNIRKDNLFEHIKIGSKEEMELIDKIIDELNLTLERLKKLSNDKNSF